MIYFRFPSPTKNIPAVQSPPACSQIGSRTSCNVLKANAFFLSFCLSFCLRLFLNVCLFFFFFSLSISYFKSKNFLLLFLFPTLKAITFYLTLSFSLFVYWKQKLFSSLFLFLTLKHKLSILSACLSVHPFCSSLFFSSSNHTAMLGSKPLQYKMGLQVLFLSRLCFFFLLRRSSNDRALHPIK